MGEYSKKAANTVHSPSWKNKSSRSTPFCPGLFVSTELLIFKFVMHEVGFCKGGLGRFKKGTGSPCNSPCPSVFMSFSLSVCVPLPVRLCPSPFSLCPSPVGRCPSPVRCLSPVGLCPCPCPSVSLCVCVLVRLWPCPCPSVSLSVCVPVPIPVRLCPCPSVSLSAFVSVSVWLVSLSLFGNWQLSMLIYCQKNQRIKFKVTFVANENFSALITPGWQATDNFQRLVRPFQRTRSKVTCQALYFTIIYISCKF